MADWLLKKAIVGWRETFPHGRAGGLKLQDSEAQRQRRALQSEKVRKPKLMVLARALVVDRRLQDRHRSSAGFCDPARGDRRIRGHRQSAIRHPDGDRLALDGRLYLRRTGQANSDHPQHRRGGDLRYFHSVLPCIPSFVAGLDPGFGQGLHQGFELSVPVHFLHHRRQHPGNGSRRPDQGLPQDIRSAGRGLARRRMVGTLVGVMLGLGAYHTFFFVVVPIMAGGVGKERFRSRSAIRKFFTSRRATCLRRYCRR